MLGNYDAGVGITRIYCLQQQVVAVSHYHYVVASVIELSNLVLVPMN